MRALMVKYTALVEKHNMEKSTSEARNMTFQQSVNQGEEQTAGTCEGSVREDPGLIV